MIARRLLCKHPGCRIPMLNHVPGMLGHPQGRRREEEERKGSGNVMRSLCQGCVASRRAYSVTPRRQDSMTVVLGVGAIGMGLAGNYVLQAYKELAAQRREEEAISKTQVTQPKEKMNKPPSPLPSPSSSQNSKWNFQKSVVSPGASAATDEAKSTSNDGETAKEAAKGTGAAGEEQKSENFFSRIWSANKNPLGKRFYDGPFEETMTRREAALILGVRESASIQRIKDSHRRILMLNHPDKGGSTFLALKINAAKELLLKGRE